MIRFVRQLRLPHWKRGFAVDTSGKRWRGFYANRTPAEVHFSAILGGVGICVYCGSRVYQGWECMDSRMDVCDDCVLLPDPDHVYVVQPRKKKEWRKLRKEFLNNANFDHKWRNQNPGGPSS